MGLSASRASSTVNSSHAKMVQQLISQNCVVIFSKTTCPYCTQAKKIFQDLQVPYHAVELNHHPEGQDIQCVLRDMTNAKTVPRVFINGSCVGGATETKSLHKTGELLELVKKCEVSSHLH